MREDYVNIYIDGAFYARRTDGKDAFEFISDLERKGYCVLSSYGDTNGKAQVFMSKENPYDFSVKLTNITIDSISEEEQKFNEAVFSEKNFEELSDEGFSFKEINAILRERRTL